jgi:hypothetical protein
MTARLIVIALAISTTTAVAAPETHIGVVTDTMCAADHAAMKIAPDHKCVRQCVGDGRTYQYALLKGKEVFRLSDQETPARFAGQKVKVTGQLYPRTGILRVDRMELAR